MYENMCGNCGGSTMDGERICDSCLADNNGGFCISAGGCPNKAVPGEGFCDEHLRLMRDSYAELYNQVYCRHGVERDTDGCWQCDQEAEYCDRCEHHYSECACFSWLPDGTMVERTAAESKLIVEMKHREDNWNWHILHPRPLPPIRDVVGVWIANNSLDDIPF
jgi:hypothetical protein